MKTKNQVLKSTKSVCYVAFAFWAVGALIFVLRVLKYCGFLGNFEIYMGLDIAPIKWYADADGRIAQWIELFGVIISTGLLLILIFRFLQKTLSAFKTDNIFCTDNVIRLYALAVTDFFYKFFSDNAAILRGSRAVLLDSDPFTGALLILVVAMLYRLAVIVSEENSLTI